jgi:hypothetical protein
MQYFLFGMAALAGMLLLLHWGAGLNAAGLARSMTLAGGLGTLVLGLAMLLRGWVFAGIGLAGFGAYLLLRLVSPSTWARWKVRPSAAPRNVSRVTTDHLDVELEHETGVMRGNVLKGFFVGRDLETLRPVELAHLWADCQFADPQSAQILEAYLDRIHPTWRDDMARTAGPRAEGARDEQLGSDRAGRPPADDGRMTRAEALDILGLKPDASEQQIRRAHRDLMLKLHPDRGGSHVLAAKVNEAKDVLLG